MLRRNAVQFALKPPLRRLPALPHPPWGVRGGLSVATGPACASAWTCGPRDSAHSSGPPPRGRVRPRSRPTNRWLPRPDRPARSAATARVDLRSGATSVPAADGRASRPGPRRCSAPRRRAAPAAPCLQGVPPLPASSPPARSRSPASAQQRHGQAHDGPSAEAHSPTSQPVSSVACRSSVMPATGQSRTKSAAREPLQITSESSTTRHGITTTLSSPCRRRRPRSRSRTSASSTHPVPRRG